MQTKQQKQQISKVNSHQTPKKSSSHAIKSISTPKNVSPIVQQLPLTGFKLKLTAKMKMAKSGTSGDEDKSTLYKGKSSTFNSSQQASTYEINSKDTVADDQVGKSSTYEIISSSVTDR